MSEVIRRLVYRESWMRWYDLPVLKRLALARFICRKHWHPNRKRLALARYLYWVLLRGCDTEICARCGGPVRLCFHVPDALWEAHAEFPGSNARDVSGEAAAGVLCPHCFTDLAGGLLWWTCSRHDAVMRG